VVTGTPEPVNHVNRGTRIPAFAQCPTGGKALGGGAEIVPDRSNASDADLVLQSSFPRDADTWEVEVVAIRRIGGADSSFTVTPYVMRLVGLSAARTVSGG